LCLKEIIKGQGQSIEKANDWKMATINKINKHGKTILLAGMRIAALNKKQLRVRRQQIYKNNTHLEFSCLPKKYKFELFLHFLLRYKRKETLIL
jgi:hypothetical protein